MSEIDSFLMRCYDVVLGYNYGSNHAAYDELCPCALMLDVPKQDQE